MAPPRNIDRVTAVWVFSNHSTLDPAGVLQFQNSTSNITLKLPQNEDPVVLTDTNQPHSPLPIPNANSLIKERMDLTENNIISTQ